MAELKDKIEELVLKHLNKDLFLVELKVSGGKNPQKVTVLIDSDKGVSIDECASVSRSLSADIEELELIDGKYILDVSSPGVDQPLKLQRQYQKNIGRNVKVLTLEGEEVKGKLKSVNDEGVTLSRKPSKKVKEAVEDFIPFDRIKYTKVIISFK